MRDRRKKFILEQSQNIFIFSAYTDACTSSCKIVVASKRPLILSKIVATGTGQSHDNTRRMRTGEQ